MTLWGTWYPSNICNHFDWIKLPLSNIIVCTYKIWPRFYILFLTRPIQILCYYLSRLLAHNSDCITFSFESYHNFQVIKCMIISATSIKWYNHKYCSTIYVIKSFISRNRIVLIFKGTKDKILSAIHILQVCVSKDQGKVIISLDIKSYIGK